MALGSCISVTAFTLVALNISVHYLRLADHPREPLRTSLEVVPLIASLAVIAFFVKTQPSNSTSVE